MTNAVKEKEIKTVDVSFIDFTDPEFIPPGSFYIRNAFGEYVFYKTGERAKAQEAANKVYGKGKYTVVAAKLEKGGSKLESGEYSVRGTSTRRGQHRG